MRLERLQKWLQEKDASGVIITGRKNIHYYSGFRGSNGLLIVRSDGHKELVTDFRYLSQAADQAPDWPVRQCSGDAFSALAEYLKEQAGNWLFEDQYMTVREYQTLPTQEKITYHAVNIDFFRQIKSEDEITKIRKAAQIADQAFFDLIEWLEPGKRERDVQIFLDHKMMELGAERTSFPTIVGSGPNGALPHATPGARELTDGDLVVIDFGAIYEGYCSDETRTISIGKATEEQKRIYQIVLSAQLASLEAVKPGALVREVDRVARDMITNAGYGDRFGHGLGHSLGLDVHENPRFSPLAEPVELVENMVMTVEPGIYLPDWGGIRIEDLVVVRPDGCEILSSTTKELIEIL